MTTTLNKFTFINPPVSPSLPLNFIQWLGPNFVSHIFKFSGNYNNYRDYRL